MDKRNCCDFRSVLRYRRIENEGYQDGLKGFALPDGAGGEQDPYTIGWKRGRAEREAMRVAAMKAITLYQPWASLIAVGAKRIETRSWPTNYRGPLAIHAAKSTPGWVKETWNQPGAFRTAVFQALYPHYSHTATNKLFEGNKVFSLEDLPTGVVVATCTLIGCVQIPKQEALWFCPHCQEAKVFGPRPDGCKLIDLVRIPPPITSREWMFGDYTPGRYAWILADIEILAEPIPAVGRQGLWDWEGEAR